VIAATERATATGAGQDHLRDPARRTALAAIIDGYRENADSTYALVADIDRRVLAASDRSRVGRLVDLHGSNVLHDRGWEGLVTEDGVRSVVAHAPVLNEEGWWASWSWGPPLPACRASAPVAASSSSPRRAGSGCAA
jgi:Single cache domain 3